MDDQEKRALNVDNLEVVELEDEDLEHISGGDVTNNCINTAAGCGQPLPKPPL